MKKIIGTLIMIFTILSVAMIGINTSHLRLIPVIPHPGHPGGVYTEVTATVYGPLEIDSVGVTDSSVSSKSHISPNKLSAFISFVADVRRHVTVTYDIIDHREDGGLIYVTAQTQSGVEISINGSGGNGKWEPDKDSIVESENDNHYDANDNLIAGVPPKYGATLTHKCPWNMYFYDNGSDKDWNGSDTIWIDDNRVYYDRGIDTYVGGLDKENQGPGSIEEPQGWNLYYYDNKSYDGMFNESIDWIGLDNDNDTVYTDRPDVVINWGNDNRQDVTNGDELKDLDESKFFAVDVNNNGKIDLGDEVVKIINNHDGKTDIADGMKVYKFDNTAKYYDKNGNGYYDEGDEIVLDYNNNNKYDSDIDKVINYGNDNKMDVRDGYSLEPLNNSKFFAVDVNNNGKIDLGDEVVEIINNHDGVTDTSKTLTSAKIYKYITIDNNHYYDNFWDVEHYNGYVYAVGETNNDPLIVKFNSSNVEDIVWGVRLKYQAVRFKGIGIDQSGYIYAVGHAIYGGYYDGLIVKFDTNGNIIWQEKIGGRKDDYLEGVAVAGNYIYAVGKERSDTGGNNFDAFIVKVDKNNGNIIWQKRIGTIASDGFYDVYVYDDEIYAVGYAYNGYDALIAKFDSNGNVKWYKAWNGRNYWDLYLYDVVIYGNYVYAVGYAYHWQTPRHKDAYIVKINKNNGSIVWQKRIGNTSTDEIFNDLIVYDGYIYAFGGAENGTNWDAFIVKFDVNGNVIWQKTLDSNNKYLYGSASDGVFIFAVGKSTNDAFLMKFLNEPEDCRDSNYQVNDVNTYRTYRCYVNNATLRKYTASYPKENLNLNYQVISSGKFYGMSIYKFDNTAKYYDKNGINGYDEGDEVILDIGGNGTYSAQPDTTIGGTPPANGVKINDTEPNAWKPSEYHKPGLYFYDNGDHTWNSNSDTIWIDDGKYYYDRGKDTYVGGLDRENQGPGVSYNPFNDVYFLDVGGISTVKQISPGVWIIQSNCNDFNLYVTIYGQPIASGNRIVNLTITAE
jgi:hypothetical protein